MEQERGTHLWWVNEEDVLTEKTVSRLLSIGLEKFDPGISKAGWALIGFVTGLCVALVHLAARMY